MFLNPKSAVVAEGGLGYEIFLTIKKRAEIKVGDLVEFFIYNHIKEEAFDLYGFSRPEELDFFQKVVAISGVGPKTALSILGLAEVSDLKKAISQGEAVFLQQVSGIGKKTAERIVLELREKFINDLSSTPSTGMAAHDQQIAEALVALGYRDREALNAVRQLPPADPKQNLADRIRQALRLIAK